MLFEKKGLFSLTNTVRAILWIEIARFAMEEWRMLKKMKSKAVSMMQSEKKSLRKNQAGGNDD